jgi:hypothetical protein
MLKDKDISAALKASGPLSTDSSDKIKQYFVSHTDLSAPIIDAAFGSCATGLTTDDKQVLAGYIIS